MDVGRAYTFITSDSKWISKVLIAAAVSLVPILNLALYGYALDVLKRVYQGTDVPLPEWDDFGDYFVRGLLVAVATFIWQIPIYVLLCPFILAGSLAESMALFILGFACVLPIAILAAAIVLQVVVARYAISGQFSSMFEFGAIFDEARRGAGPLLLAMAVLFVASLVGIVAGFITCGIGFFVLTPWLTLAHAHLLGQAYRRVKALPPATTTAF